MECIYLLSYSCMGGERHEQAFTTVERAYDAAYFIGNWFTQMPEHRDIFPNDLQWLHFGRQWQLKNLPAMYTEDQCFYDVVIVRLNVNPSNLGDVHIPHAVKVMG